MDLTYSGKYLTFSIKSAFNNKIYWLSCGRRSREISYDNFFGRLDRRSRVQSGNGIG
jgi:hypothetical protein